MKVTRSTKKVLSAYLNIQVWSRNFCVNKIKADTYTHIGINYVNAYKIHNTRYLKIKNLKTE